MGGFLTGPSPDRGAALSDDGCPGGTHRWRLPAAGGWPGWPTRSPSAAGACDAADRGDQHVQPPSWAIRPAWTSSAQAWTSAKQLAASQPAGRPRRNEPSARPRPTSRSTRLGGAFVGPGQGGRAELGGGGRGDRTVAVEFLRACREHRSSASGGGRCRRAASERCRAPPDRPRHDRLQQRLGGGEVRVDGEPGDSRLGESPRCPAGRDGREPSAALRIACTFRRGSPPRVRGQASTRALLLNQTTTM